MARGDRQGDAARRGAPASPGLRPQVREEREVAGADGRRVAFGKAIGRHDGWADPPRRRDVAVPSSAIREVTGERVWLRIPAAEVDRRGWPHPPLV